VKRLLGLSILALSLPAAASVGQLSQAKAVQFEAISQVLDGVTVMELEETGKHVRRVVLRPDFKNGPGAAFTVRF